MLLKSALKLSSAVMEQANMRTKNSRAPWHDFCVGLFFQVRRNSKLLRSSCSAHEHAQALKMCVWLGCFDCRSPGPATYAASKDCVRLDCKLRTSRVGLYSEGLGDVLNLAQPSNESLPTKKHWAKQCRCARSEAYIGQVDIQPGSGQAP